ncbi:MAG: hypothetical protein A2Y12_20545 [Planctomycetes bacterium GWF2_42_9]|nr:MAG: hypothetical protein A2Y12_20545 [Planctomycetes bacterium GWF2_42_9]
MAIRNFNSENVTIHTVAELAGVSIGTASRALCNRDGVSNATRQKVLKVAAELRFRHKTLTRTYNIALIMPPLQELRSYGLWYSVSIYEAMCRLASQKKWGTQIFDPRDMHELMDSQVDGILSQGGVPEILAMSDRFKHVPKVAVNDRKNQPWWVVQTNHKQGGYLAGKLLVEAGHKRIAMLTSPFHWDTEEREDGIREAMLDGGLNPADLMIFRTGRGDWENGLGRVLSAKPTALFIGFEDLTLFVQSRIVAKYGLQVPDDISIVGFHIPGISDLHYPALTAIEQPYDFLAAKAVEQLENLMASETSGKPMTVSLDNKVWLGQSIGSPKSE